MSIKKRILAGLLSGALLLTGSAALAAPAEEQDNTWREEAQSHIGGWAKYFSDNYGVDSAQVEKAMKDGVHVEDIRQAAVLAKLSGRKFSDVLAMKVGWSQVAEKLGIKREQLKEFYKQERDAHFAKRAGVDVKTFQNLLKAGYNPHDIGIAGKIAKASGKDIKSVLDKRKINNTWGDVAKSFGVDLKKIMPPPGHHPHHR